MCNPKCIVLRENFEKYESAKCNTLKIVGEQHPNGSQQFLGATPQFLK